jgi:hypothetical protein
MDVSGFIRDPNANIPWYNMQSPQKGHDAFNDGRKHNLKGWGTQGSSETDDYMASSQETQSCSDVGSSSFECLESESSGDEHTLEHLKTNDSVHATDLPPSIELVVKNTFMHFGPFTDRTKLRRAFSADCRRMSV